MAGKHVVVIGAGIGGLVSAALLGARGFAVTLVEAAATPGGKLRELKVGAGGGSVAIDAGPTVFTMRRVFDDIFEACGTSLDAELTLNRAGLIARHAWGDDRLDLFADPDRSEAAIGDFAGADEARGYRAFRAEAARIFATLDRPFMRAPATCVMGLTWRVGIGGIGDLMRIRPYERLWGALGRHFRDARLRQLFARYATYCGSSPFACPATLMLVAHVEASGVWLVEGGMYRLALALEQLARRQGVVFRYGSPVRDIIVERGRAGGVTLASGERIAADAVLCNADPAAMAHGMFGPDVAQAVVPAPRQRSLSALVWTAAAPMAGFPLVRHNVFFSGDYRAEFDALAAGQLIDAPSVYVCAQDRDDAGGRVGSGAERIQVIVNAPAFGDRRVLSGGEMAAATARMTDRLARSGLAVELDPHASQLTTPADFEALFPGTGGGLYGAASHGASASFQRQGSRTRIKGLYCAGGSTHPGPGVPMSALSGQLAVAALEADSRQ